MTLKTVETTSPSMARSLRARGWNERRSRLYTENGVTVEFWAEFSPPYGASEEEILRVFDEVDHAG